MQDILQKLKDENNYRFLRKLKHLDKYVIYNDQKLLNLAGNDYLNLANDKKLKQEFLENLKDENLYFSSSSSRSLSGNFEIFEE
ncbi:pyridoxal phosphate-dependent aminotransferase family protein, partial [Campylobacter volucris]|nr:pyridoxal phosphate-dependent aminotransferase family protein [Campylobacter volucris]